MLESREVSRRQKDKVVIILHYQEIVDYIEEIPKFSTKHPLEHTKKLLSCLGNPQDGFKVIHVAGTNGKGSTCAYLASMFREGGRACGLFISPHLVTIRERFQIDGRMISEEDFVEIFGRVKEQIERFVENGEGHPSYFETLFVMGMLYFRKKQVEYVVLETGLGGRLDATNTVERPLASIITSISLDHTEWLGDTVTAIAGEKAGIIKAGVPVIYDGHVPEASAVIRGRAEALLAPVYELEEAMAEVVAADREGIAFRFRSPYCRYGASHSLHSALSDDECGPGFSDYAGIAGRARHFGGTAAEGDCPHLLAGAYGDGDAGSDHRWGSQRGWGGPVCRDGSPVCRGVCHHTAVFGGGR